MTEKMRALNKPVIECLAMNIDKCIEMAKSEETMFEHHTTIHEHYVSLKIKGRIDGLSARQLEQALNDIISQGLRKIVANLQEINYISSTGLRVFLKIQKKLHKIDGEIILQKPSSMVLEVLEMTGFNKILQVVSSEKISLNETQADGERQETFQGKNGKLRITAKPLSNEKGNYRIIGSTEKMKTASYGQSDVVEIPPADIEFGLGLAALGNDYAQYKQYFGESLAVYHNLLVYPAREKSAVDALPPGSESFKFLNGVAFSGPFQQICLVEAESGFFDLETFAEWIRQKSRSNLTGVVFLAESKGLWGMNLRKTPIDSPTDNIFARQSIMKWLDFPIEAADFDALVLGAGLVTHEKDRYPQIFGADSGFHIHGAVIQDEMLNKSFTAFKKECQRLILEADIQKIQHLLGQSQFRSLLCGTIQL